MGRRGRFLQVYGECLGSARPFWPPAWSPTLAANCFQSAITRSAATTQWRKSPRGLKARDSDDDARIRDHGSQMEQADSESEQCHLAVIDKHLQLGLVTPAVSNFMADVEEEECARSAWRAFRSKTGTILRSKRNLAELRGRCLKTRIRFALSRIRGGIPPIPFHMGGPEIEARRDRVGVFQRERSFCWAKNMAPPPLIIPLCLSLSKRWLPSGSAGLTLSKSFCT